MDNAMDSLVTTLQELPFGVFGAAIVALAAGLVLWLAGRMVIKPIFAVIGGVTGSMLGFFFLPLVAPETIAEWPSTTVGLAVGAVLGLAVAIVLFRFTMAISTAVVLGILGGLGAATYLHFDSIHQNEVAAYEAQALSQADQFLPDIPRSDSSPTGDGTQTASDGDQPELNPAQRASKFVQELYEELVVPWWDRQPVRSRFILSGTVFVGAAMGLLIGLAMPVKSAAVTTAMAGSAVWLPNAAFLLTAANLPGHGALARLGPMGSLIVWIVIAAIGMVFQISSIGKSNDNDKDDDDD
jgi:hypothetical protein